MKQGLNTMLTPAAESEFFFFIFYLHILMWFLALDRNIIQVKDGGNQITRLHEHGVWEMQILYCKNLIKLIVR